MRNAFGVVIAVVISACSSSGPPAATSAASSPTPTATAAATSAAPTTAIASPTARVLPPGITDLSQVFKPLASGWRPTGTTLVVARAMVSGDITLVAVPLGPRGAAGAPIPIVSFVPDRWALRQDGGALAVSVWTGHGARIAVWDIRLSTARWLTPDEPGTSVLTPVWSIDGSSVYYLATSDDLRTAAIFAIGADGSGRKQLRAAEARTASLDGLTPDGKGIVWTAFGAGGTVEVLDISTGVARHLENTARVASWRERQPRALLSVGGCCAGRPGGELVLWDDVAMTSRVVAARGQFGDPAWLGGAWDPSGTRIAAVRIGNAAPANTVSYETSLVVINAETGAVQPIADTQGAGQVLWLPDGIVFTRPLRIGMEVMLLTGTGGPAVSVYQDSGLIQRIEVPR